MQESGVTVFTLKSLLLDRKYGGALNKLSFGYNMILVYILSWRVYYSRLGVGSIILCGVKLFILQNTKLPTYLSSMESEWFKEQRFIGGKLPILE